MYSFMVDTVTANIGEEGDTVPKYSEGKDTGTQAGASMS